MCHRYVCAVQCVMNTLYVCFGDLFGYVCLCAICIYIYTYIYVLYVYMYIYMHPSECHILYLFRCVLSFSATLAKRWKVQF